MTALAITDSGDGSGASIAVSGSPGGDTSIYVAQFAGSLATLNWASVGTVTGDGSLAYAQTTMGPYVATGVDGAGVPVTPVSFRLTDAAAGDPLHYEIMYAIREYVLGLALPGVTADPENHRVVKFPYRPNLELNLETELRDTCVFYFPIAETYAAHTNEDDTVVFPVNVLFVRKLGKKLELGMKRMLDIRQKFAQSMSRCPLPDVEEVHTVDISPGSVYLPEQWSKQLDASNIVFRCKSELPAGLL